MSGAGLVACPLPLLRAAGGLAVGPEAAVLERGRRLAARVSLLRGAVPRVLTFVYHGIHRKDKQALCTKNFTNESISYIAYYMILILIP